MTPRSSDSRAAYDSLLLTYPAAWRRVHADIVLDTLMSVHADCGKARPSLSERVDFAIDGLRVRFAGFHHHRPDRRFASLAALAPVRPFDQSNGVVTDARPLEEWEQVRANAARGQNTDEQRVAPLAWFTLDAMSRSDHARRDRQHRDGPALNHR